MAGDQGPLLRAVLFDLDGVIFDTERLYMRATGAALREMGVIPTATLLHALIGLSDEDCDAVMVSRLGPIFCLESFKASYRLYRDQMLADGVPLRPGVQASLQAISEMNVVVAAVTNGSEHASHERLAATGTLRHFDHVIAHDGTMRPKPAPDLFARALDRLGLDCRECLAVEDSAVGITAASLAGIDVIAVLDVQPTDQGLREKCVRVVDDLAEVVELVRGRRGASVFPSR